MLCQPGIYSPIYPQFTSISLPLQLPQTTNSSEYHLQFRGLGEQTANDKRTNNHPQPGISHLFRPSTHLLSRRLTPLNASPPLKLSDRRKTGFLSHMLPIATATTTTAAPRSEQPHSQRTDPLSANGLYPIPTSLAN